MRFKKIVAYSTCSQLGFMLFSLGCSDFFPSFFHLLSHALFKALLFLVCGSSIHVFYHNQDLRKYGGFIYVVPMISLWLIVGLWSLIGFPLFVGFFSKDLVVQFFYLRYFVSNFLLWILFIWCILVTCMYVCVLWWKCFFSYYKGYRRILYWSRECGFLFGFILSCLIFLCVNFIFFKYYFISLEAHLDLLTDSFENTVCFEYSMLCVYQFLRWYPIFFGILGVWYFFSIYYWQYVELHSKAVYGDSFFFIFCKTKSGYDKLVNSSVYYCHLYLCLYLYKYIEKGLCELQFPYLVVFQLRFLQKWYKYHTWYYDLLFIVIWLLTIISFYVLFLK